MVGRIALVPVLALALGAGCGHTTFIPCPISWGCGTNAASMGNIVFHELDSSGQLANAEGVTFKGFADPTGQPWTLQIEQQDRLAAVDSGGTTHRGTELIGAILLLERAGGQRFDVKIADYGEIDYWVHPVEKVPTYTFEYRPAMKPGEVESKPFVRLCTGKEVSTEWTAKGLHRQLALVFSGDRYDAAKKTVISGTPNWFNIACAGTAIAKLHLLRHTEAGSIVGSAYHPTFDERQGMLKMITDDICGTGRSFTVDGELVYYMDNHAPAWHPFPAPTPPLSSLEALWSKDGAICLDEPRRLHEDGPAILPVIAKECGAKLPPSCKSIGVDLTNWSATWSTVPSAYGISANP